MNIASTFKVSLITALVTMLSFTLVSCGDGIGGTGSPFNTADGGIGGTGAAMDIADGGIGGTGSPQASPFAVAKFNLEGTVPGTLIEAFCSDGSYQFTKSEENGTNEHPYKLAMPQGVFCRLVMTTNEDDPENKVVTPIKLVNSQGAGGIAFSATEDIDIGFADLALTRLDMKLDANQDGVEDAPLDIVVEADIEILTKGADPLDTNNNGIIDLYEDDDGDGITNKDDNDDDGNSILDINEPDRADDLDGDGIPNAEDADEDNNGERDKIVVPTTGDGGNTSGDNTVVLIAKDDQSSTDKNVPVTINVVNNDTDPEGAGLKIARLSEPENGTVIEEAGLIKYTPNTNFAGTDTFTYTVVDANNKEVTATVTVVVNDVNDVPVLQDDIATTDEGKPVTIDVLANDTDVDEDLLSIVSFGNPANGNVREVEGKLVYTPKFSFSGEDAFTYVATDSKTENVTATVNVTVNKVNKAPDAKNDIASTDENKSVSIDVLSNDTDPDGDTLVITQLGTPANGVVAKQDGKVRYTPKEAFSGEDSFSYSIDDGNKHVVSATVVVTVNRVNKSPVANDDQAAIDQTIIDDTTTNERNVVAIDVLGNDTDPDGDNLEILRFTNPANGSVANKNGKLEYTPNNDFFGEDTFTYTISDGKGLEATAIVAVTVNNVNKAPVAINDQVITNEEIVVVIDVLSNDSDADGDLLLITQLSDPANGSVAIVEQTAKLGEEGGKGGKIEYTPKKGFSGFDTFTYGITDGSEFVATANVVVDVNKVNKFPVAVDDSAVTDENQAVVLDVLANDVDPDGDTLSISQLGDPENGTIKVLGQSGKIEYTPATDFSGNDSFSYVISDGNNHEVTATARVAVNAVNRPPVAKDDVATTNENQAVTIDVLANDTDPDGDELNVVKSATSENGSVEVVEGQIQYTPSKGFSGTDTFAYTITDGNRQEVTATVTVTVVDVNQAPIAQDDEFSISINQGNDLNVLENDSDSDGDSLTIKIVTPASKGLAIVATELLVPQITYFPLTGATGTDTFTYTVADGEGLISNIATVTLTIEQ